ncbi:PREDICTED: uncharacterized protein LOC106923608 [Poecilia mexicana]|uniref:uncharacterized protein LOC106906163 n=1 Tax=Poecilia mexicana TaxID=48701 RepID=UPI00072E6C20|nr:PREDICTED: uncharacterized protein LOC106906163 [Poecilia mexicana]XP_014852226.1 PREDICTED: uncharacterized protein LOC106923608 [Poecilia mexicana]
MPTLGAESATRLLKLVQHAVSMFLLVVLFSILQYVFDMHFICSCRPGLHPSGFLYLFLPPLILTFVVNIVEPFYRRKPFSSQRVFRCYCPSSCCGHYFVKLIIRFTSLTALWISLVFFDGDWYFCLRTNLNSTQTGMPCKKNLTYEEERTRDYYKTMSLDIGLGLCCSFLFLWSISEVWRAWKPGYRCGAPYYSVVYDNLLAEEVGNHLNEELQKMAKEKAEKLCENYIKSIRHHEHLENGENVFEISEVWGNVSASSFYMTEVEREKTGENNHEQEQTE